MSGEETCNSSFCKSGIKTSRSTLEEDAFPREGFEEEDMLSAIWGWSSRPVRGRGGVLIRNWLDRLGKVSSQARDAGSASSVKSRCACRLILD